MDRDRTSAPPTTLPAAPVAMRGRARRHHRVSDSRVDPRARGVAALALAAAIVLAIVGVAGAAVPIVLTSRKVAVLKDLPGTGKDRGTFRFAKDPALADPPAPTCPTVTTVQVAFYPQATNRLDARPPVDIPCAAWRPVRGGWVYADPDAGRGGVARIVYKRGKLTIKLRGAGFAPITGPVGYLEVWFTVGADRHVGRFHSFARNQATSIKTRKPSAAAAAGEDAFWDVLHATNGSTARQDAALALLRKATRREPRDGRSHFLLAMLHLYRFGQATTRFDQVSDFARAELAAAHAAFDRAVPLLWDGTAGDSRVPGFAAATRYTHGLVIGDDALRDEGLAELATAVAANQFFNVFDYIPVAQAAPAGSPLFATVFTEVDDYLSDPDTLACIATQPEICGNAGLAPHNAEGALLLFGDLYAKAGELTQAQSWYGLASALGAAGAVPWSFQTVADDRLATATARVALYQDADPSNDPPVIGAAAEACSVCHAQ